MRLILLCAAALVGLAVGDLGRLAPAGLVPGGVLALLGVGLTWRRPGWRMLALVVCAAALGGLRASLVTFTPDAGDALEPYLGVLVRLRGVVVQPPSIGPTAARLQLEAHGVGPAGRDPPAPSEPALPAAPVRVVGEPAELGALAVGDALVLEGRLLAGDGRGPPTLLYPKVLGRESGPAVAPAALLGSVRAAAQAGIQRYLPEPQASLSAGVLLGGGGRLDAEFRQQLQRAGLAHVLAIDGFKQVVVAGLLGAVAVRLLGPKTGALSVLLGVAGYTLLTGAHPAAVRAALMVGLATLAARTGRLADPLTGVLVAATGMAAVEPRILLDVGLQLSLSATLGIVLLWPRLRPRLTRVPRAIAEPAGLTLAVTLATLPVTLSVFQQVSLVSPVAHILAVPLLPLVLVSSALLALASPIPQLAAGVAWLAWLPSTLLAAIVRFCGGLPGAALSTGRLPPLAAGCLAAVLLAWGLWGLPEVAGLRLDLRRKSARSNLARSLWPPAAGIATCLAGAAALELVRPDGQLHVERLAVGRGEAILVRGPTGRTVLVVGGRLDGVQLAAGVAERLPVWEHGLGSVLQLDAAAQAGLSLTLARYPPAQQLDAQTDARVDLGGGAVLDVYAADGHGMPAASISFGDVWQPLTGRPPPPSASGDARPLLQPDQDQEIQHDHDEHDDQLHSLTDDHLRLPNRLVQF